MRKNTTSALLLLLCLATGIFVGLVIPRGALPWDNLLDHFTDKISVLTPAETPATTVAPTPTVTPPTVAPPASNDVDETATPAAPVETTAPEALNPRDNAILLNTAFTIVDLLYNEDYTTLASYIDPDRGVAFTPLSNVDATYDKVLFPSDFKNAATDTRIYNWGVFDGSGFPIELTIHDYFDRFVNDADYLRAPQMGIDQIRISGNSLENVSEAYPNCRFVEFSYAGRDPSLEGIDWCSLKIVLAPTDTSWVLVGVVHGEWTI